MEVTEVDAERPRLTAIAIRILRSETDADDVLQETWIRLSRADDIDDLPAWLTTTVTRLCLDQLRKRRTRSVAETEGATEPRFEDTVRSGVDAAFWDKADLTGRGASLSSPSRWLARRASNEAMSNAPDGNSRGPVHSRYQEEFEEVYAGTPPWDIGRPQPVFLRLTEAGNIQGRVLDAGCGTGEHVLMAAERGLDATGIDVAPRAIAAAQRKAAERGLTARFLVWDALRLADLEEHFDTVMDSGLFHVFDDDRRTRYIEELAKVLQRGARCFMCCFSDRQPGDWGPRRVRRDEMRAAFSVGWEVESIEAAQFETNLDPPIVEAWLAVITRS